MRLSKWLWIVTALTITGATLRAQGFTFTRIVQSGDPVPGGGTFAGMQLHGVDASGRAIFSSIDNSANFTGLYASSAGSTALLADYTMIQPGGTEQFSFIQPASVDGTKVYFRGVTASTDGLYYQDSGGLHSLITLGTAAPGGGTFGSFLLSSPTASNDKVVFAGSVTSPNDSLFLSQTGVVSRLLAAGDAVSGHAATLTGGFNSFRAGNDNGNVAVRTTSSLGQLLIGYTPGNGAISVADFNTAAPGAGTNFTSFGSSAPSVDGNSAYFQGSYAGGSGIYGVNITGGAVSAIADITTAVPGGSGNFTSFDDYTVAGNGVVAFVGNYAGGRGIFLNSNNTFYRVIGTGDIIDGQTVTGLSLGLDSITDDNFAFIVTYSGGADAIYETSLAAIPEPATAGMLCGLVALAGLTLRSRMRSRA